MRLLIIGGGIEQIPAYKKAKEMELEVVGVDMNPEAPALEFADDKIIKSTYDTDGVLAAVLEYHKEKPFDGVMTVAHDATVTVATIAKELGLPGIPVESAILATNKFMMKKQFKKDGVPIPPFHKVSKVGTLKNVIGNWGYPVIIKPIDSCAARGVLRITPTTDLEWAFKEASKFSRKATFVMAEKFVEGRQISSETIMYKGKAYTAMFSQRNYEFIERFSPFIIENGGTLPADLTDLETKQLNELVQKAANSLGIKNGTVKGDLVMTKDGPVIIEMAARMGGGYAVSDSIPATVGVEMIPAAINIALGKKVDVKALVPVKKQAAVLRFFFPEYGILKSISGFEELTDDWVLKKGMYIKPGEAIEPVTNHTKRAGFVIALGKDTAEAKVRAEQAISSVKFEVIK